MKQYATTAEVAEQLRCSVSSVQSLVSRNAIPFRRVAGVRRTLFIVAEVEAWIDGCELEVVEVNGSRTVRPKRVDR